MSAPRDVAHMLRRGSVNELIPWQQPRHLHSAVRPLASGVPSLFFFASSLPSKHQPLGSCDACSVRKRIPGLESAAPRLKSNLTVMMGRYHGNFALRLMVAAITYISGEAYNTRTTHRKAVAAWVHHHKVHTHVDPAPHGRKGGIHLPQSGMDFRNVG